MGSSGGAKQTTSLNELINSPELNALIEEALAANPNLQQTVLTLKILRAQRYQARADRLPELSLDVATENGEDDMNSYSGSLSISWEIDLWQKLADSESAAGMDEAADLRTTVAYKDVLPSISLGAVLKDLSDSPQSLRLTDPVWILLGQLSASLFQGGS